MMAFYRGAKIANFKKREEREERKWIDFFI